MTSPSSSNTVVDRENNVGQEETGSPSDETPGSYQDRTDVPPVPSSHVQPLSSSHQDLAMPSLSDSRMNISFLCNPNNHEDHTLRQPNSNSLQNKSWSKDSTCEQTSLISLD